MVLVVLFTIASLMGANAISLRDPAYDMLLNLRTGRGKLQDNLLLDYYLLRFGGQGVQGVDKGAVHSYTQDMWDMWENMEAAARIRTQDMEEAERIRTQEYKEAEAERVQEVNNALDKEAAARNRARNKEDAARNRAREKEDAVRNLAREKRESCAS